MGNLSYSQLEGAWIQAGGSQSLAPLMAAIALAESRGNPNARNDNDNGGTQSSFGLWQISTGTHTPPSSNWSDPVANAKLAVGKYQSQGLEAWGTYTSGAYRKFLANGVPPSAPGAGSGPLAGGGTVTASPVSTVDATCAWSLNLPVAGNVCIAKKTQVRAGIGVIVGLTGLGLCVTGMVLLTVYGLNKSVGNIMP